MHFANTQYLHLFWLLPIFAFWMGWTFRLKKKAFRQFAEDRLVSGLISGISAAKQVVRAVLFLLFLVFALLALVRPQWGTKLETVKRAGVDIMVALDTSLSMETQDIVPSRLEKAKHEVKALIDILQGDRVGLIVFAGSSMVNCPLTIDQNAVKLFLEIVDTQVIPRPGTNIGEAIGLATQSFSPQESRRHKVLVLVTDGENLEGDPIRAAEEAKNAGVLVFTLGIGSGAGEPIPLRDEKGSVAGYKKDENGSVVVSRLDEATLEKISTITGGRYFRATTGEDELQKIYDAVSQMDKKEFQTKVYLTYVDRFQIPLGIALFFVLLESLISDSRNPKFTFSWLRLPGLTRKRGTQ
jgi:Ca-activated chloride channel family protein